MDMSEHIENLINAIGGIAEMLSLFHKQLLHEGFDETQAMYLTGEFMKAMIMSPPRGGVMMNERNFERLRYALGRV